MEKKLPIYELFINEDDDTIVNKISLVTDPAIELDFVAFAAQDKTNNFKFKLESVAERKLVGVFMVPNQKIYRVNKDAMGNVVEEYYVVMSKETIAKAVQKFFKYGYTSNTNIQHDKDIKDVYLIESWITTSKNDKLKNYGFKDVPEGSWAGTIYVENTNIWDNYIKTGELKGFSIEGNFLKSNEPIKEDFKIELDKDLMLLTEIVYEFLNENNKENK